MTGYLADRSPEGSLEVAFVRSPFAHAAINTWQDQSGPIETCEVCHGDTADFSVEKVHAISHPYKPPYSRE